MKRLRLISVISVAVIAAATAIMSWCIYDVYVTVKADVMRTVGECVGRADVLELIHRMDPPEGRADEAAVRLGSYVAASQSGYGMSIASSDTLRTSLSALLRFGLDFDNGNERTDFHVLDSIFVCELARNGLHPREAFILPPGRQPDKTGDFWTCGYRLSPSAETTYVAYVSPLDGHILGGMTALLVSGAVLVVSVGLTVMYLLATMRRMRTIEQMKDDLTHNMTHELKTPVAVALSAADSMRRYYDPADEERNRRMLDIITGRLTYLADMIEKILSVSLVRFRNLHPDMTEVAVKPLIENAAEQIRLKAVKPVEIAVSVEPADLTVTADRVHLGNVIVNLLDNAVKYSGERVSVKIEATAGRLTVCDDGIGIDRSDLPHIFEKFYRVPHGDRYVTEGFGLGLYYVGQIVGQMGWSIDVSSRKGEGTQFTIIWHG